MVGLAQRAAERREDGAAKQVEEKPEDVPQRRRGAVADGLEPGPDVGRHILRVADHRVDHPLGQNENDIKLTFNYNATDADISPAMKNLVETYHAVLNESDAAAIAGLLAYEAQGADIADTKAEGLRAHYGASNTATTFWDVHGNIEADHASWTMEALESLNADDVIVLDAARRVANAWWDFLTERDSLIAA